MSAAIASCSKLLELILHESSFDSVSCNAVIHRLVQILRTIDAQEYGDFTWYFCGATLGLCCKAPNRIDHLLRLYYKLAERAPRPDGVPRWQECCCELVNTMGRYGGLSLIGPEYEHWTKWRPLAPGRQDAADGSKLIFTKEEIEEGERFEEIKYATRYQARKKNADIVAGAVEGRHAALMATGECTHRGVMRQCVSAAELAVEEYLAKGERARPMQWSSTFALALLLKIRAMAKSLFEDPMTAEEELENKRKRWIELLKRWLWDDDLNKGNGRLVKHHVMVSCFRIGLNAKTHNAAADAGEPSGRAVQRDKRTALCSWIVVFLNGQPSPRPYEAVSLIDVRSGPASSEL